MPETSPANEFTFVERLVLNIRCEAVGEPDAKP